MKWVKLTKQQQQPILGKRKSENKQQQHTTNNKFSASKLFINYYIKNETVCKKNCKKIQKTKNNLQKKEKCVFISK